MRSVENKDEIGGTDKYLYFERNPTSDKCINIEDHSRALVENKGVTKINRQKGRKNKSRKLKKYFNFHEKVGQVFIAILIISFLYTIGYFLEYWNDTSL